jgi:DNA-binding response OmpR family regulator
MAAFSVMRQASEFLIVVVDDNPLFCEELVVRLMLEGYSACSADSGQELDHILKYKPVDLIILDINLPYENGLSIAKRVRDAMPHIRILMLSARVTGSDKVEGYLAGADVYMTKPVKTKELLAVIISLKRRSDEKVIQHDHGWLLESRSWMLIPPNGFRIALSDAEYKIIHAMVMAPNNLIDIRVLLEMLNLSDDPAGRSRLMVKISRVRKKIDPHFDGKDCIRAIRQEGYKLNLRISLHDER